MDAAGATAGHQAGRRDRAKREPHAPLRSRRVRASDARQRAAAYQKGGRPQQLNRQLREGVRNRSRFKPLGKAEQRSLAAHRRDRGPED